MAKNEEHPQAPKRRLLAYCDGGCTGNGKQGARAYGSFAIYDVTEFEGKEYPKDVYHKKLREELTPLTHTRMDFPTRPELRATNNFAEMTTLLTLLSYVREKRLVSKTSTLVVHMDSELVLNQMRGAYRINNPALKAVHRDITRIIKDIVDVAGVPLRDMIALDWISGKVMKETVLEH